MWDRFTRSSNAEHRLLTIQHVDMWMAVFRRYRWGSGRETTQAIHAPSTGLSSTFHQDCNRLNDNDAV